MKFFEFGEDEYEYIVKKCMLNKKYSQLLWLKIHDYSRIQIADIMGYGVDNIDKMTLKLKKKIKKIL